MSDADALDIEPSASPTGTQWRERLSRHARLASGDSAIADIMAQTESPELITFSGGFPSAELFPATAIQDLTRDVLHGDPSAAMQYTPTRGLTSTREVIAGWLAHKGEHVSTLDELTITSGGMDAFGLLASAFLDPGDVVVTEAPTYLGALMSFATRGADVKGVRVDDDGLDVDALNTLLTGGLRPKLLYIIPDHQNPSGRTLSLLRRHALVGIARRYGFLIIEDVAYRELTFDAARLPSLHCLAPDVVVQAGTFSKIFFPGVRLGWALGPLPVVAAMVVAKQNADQCAGALGQRLVEEYLRRGLMEPWLERARDHYRTRATSMLDALEAAMPDTVTWTKPTGGFFLWLSTPGVDTAALAPLAAAKGVTFVPGQLFDPAKRPSHDARLSFSCVDEEGIEEGVRRLAELVRDAV